jgi:TP901 family phage tail tape measure protein
MADIDMRILLSAVGGAGVTSIIGDVANSLGGSGGGLSKALSNLTFGFRNLGTEGTIGTDALKAGFSSAGKIILQTAAIAGIAAVGISVGLGVEAVKAAGDFQSSMERLVTSAGETQKNLKIVSAGVLQMSVDTATSTDQLASGMYYVESSGYHAAAGLQVMQSAAEGAKSENADLATVSKALTTEMVDYHMAANQSASAMNGLIASVQNGKTSLQDLSSSMGAVLPIASSLGISFPQVAGAMDTMTNAGVPAQQASQNLAHVLVALSAPSAVAVKSMTSVGLSAQQVKDALVNQGLPEALQLIEDHVGKKFPAGSVANETALKNIMGGLVGLKLASQLTGGSLAETKTNIDKVSAAMKAGSQGVMGWNEIQSTFNFKVDQAKQALNAFMIQLGTQLFPVFNQLMAVLFPIIQAFLQWIVNSGIIKNILQGLVSTLQFLVTVGTAVSTFLKNNAAAMEAVRVVLIVLAIAIGVILVAALYLWISAAIMAGVANIIAFWPVYLVVAAIVAIIALVVLAVTHWGQIAGWLQGVWSAVAGFFVGLWNDLLSGLQAVGQWFANLWSGITTGVGNFFSGLESAVQAGLAAILNYFLAPFRAIGALFSWLYNHNYYFKALIDAIRNIITAGLKWLTDQWNRFTGWLGGLWSGLTGKASQAWNAISGAVSGATTSTGNWLQGAWKNTTTWLGNTWSGFKNLMSQAWSAVSGVISGAWNTYIVKPLQNLWNSMVNFANGWPKQALQWGVNLIQGFINGIKNMIGGIGNALGNVGNTIKNFLGFHSPTKEGPGSEADQWAPNLIKMYAKGLQSAMPTLQASLGLVMHPVANTLSGSAGTGIARPSSAPVMQAGHTFNISISTMARSQSEARHLVDMVEQEIARRFRGQTPGYSSGGVF